MISCMPQQTLEATACMSTSLKRLRSTSQSLSDEMTEDDGGSACDQLALLKVSKQFESASPRSSLRSAKTFWPRDAIPWPRVTSNDAVRHAWNVLKTSADHAKQLLARNQWFQAFGVLRKLEKASERVSQERRKAVLEQVNRYKHREAHEYLGAPHAVRFNDDIEVIVMDDMDRSLDDLPSPPMEEMLLLRATRWIPDENHSELWNE